MTHRYLAALLFAVLIALPAAAQQMRIGGDHPTGIPKISCTIKSSADSLFFRGNDYSPNAINVTVTIADTTQDTVKNLIVCMVQDTRFNIKGQPCTDVIPILLPYESVDVSFTLYVASERSNDGIDIIRAIATSANGASSACEFPIWVEHEYYPVFSTTCQKEFAQIVFDDNLNDYSPNPFRIKVDVINVRDGASDSTNVQYLGTRGVALDTSNTSVRDIGTLDAGEKQTLYYDIRALKRTNDTTISVCFQVTGKGGYKRKTYADTCCVDVFIPQAKQAEYQVTCNILPDTIGYIAHKYQPDPFEYDATIENIGTALGKNVKAQVVLPQGVQLAPGDSIVKSLDNLATGGRVSVKWMLKPAARFVRDTVKICVRVSDEFENGATCCDSVIIDSVRSARFDIACSGPDTIFVDQAHGVYSPDSFFVHVQVRNVGSDYADSVKATIVIQSPDIVGADPFSPIKRKVDYSTPQSDTLGVNGMFTFDWLLKALPRGVSGLITIKFKVEATNAPTEECEIKVYVPKLDAPDIELTCYTTPADTVHFDPNTGGYDPPFILYTIRVTNPGGGVAKNVQATLFLPPRVLLAPGEQLAKPVTPQDIGPMDTAIAVWRVIPLERRDFGSNALFDVEVTSETVLGRFHCKDSVFVPALPYTVAIVLPQNPVGYTGQPIEVPIYIDDPEGKNIKSMDFCFDYNVDNLGNQLADNVVSLDPRVPFVKETSLLKDWDVSIQNLSPNHLRIKATTQGPALTQMGFGPDTPLLVLIFRADYGSSPNELKYSVTDLLWPKGSALLDSVLINNGSIYPRVTDGRLTVSGDCLRPLNATDRFVISQNRPNPFNPSTTIQYALPYDSHVRIAVFDALGRSVRILVDELNSAGTHSVIFNAENLPSGVYYYRMDASGWSQVMKMIVAR